MELLNYESTVLECVNVAIYSSYCWRAFSLAAARVLFWADPYVESDYYNIRKVKKYNKMKDEFSNKRSTMFLRGVAVV